MSQARLYLSQLQCTSESSGEDLAYQGNTHSVSDKVWLVGVAPSGTLQNSSGDPLNQHPLGRVPKTSSAPLNQGWGSGIYHLSKLLTGFLSILWLKTSFPLEFKQYG